MTSTAKFELQTPKQTQLVWRVFAKNPLYTLKFRYNGQYEEDKAAHSINIFNIACSVIPTKHNLPFTLAFGAYQFFYLDGTSECDLTRIYPENIPQLTENLLVIYEHLIEAQKVFDELFPKDCWIPEQAEYADEHPPHKTNSFPTPAPVNKTPVFTKAELDKAYDEFAKLKNNEIQWRDGSDKIAIWRYDIAPYYIAGQVDEICQTGTCTIKGYNPRHFYVQPIKLIDYDPDILSQLEKLKQDYKNAEHELHKTIMRETQDLLQIPYDDPGKPIQ